MVANSLHLLNLNLAGYQIQQCPVAQKHQLVFVDLGWLREQNGCKYYLWLSLQQLGLVYQHYDVPSVLVFSSIRGSATYHRGPTGGSRGYFVGYFVLFDLCQNFNLE